jgi:uncharacterized membrane protein
MFNIGAVTKVIKNGLPSPVNNGSLPCCTDRRNYPMETPDPWQNDEKLFPNPFIDRGFKLGIPFLVAMVYLLFLYSVLSPNDFLLMGGIMVAYVIPPAGKETVIPVGIALGLPWWLVALSISMLDVISGLFMALNFDLALKIPFLGIWIGRFIAGGRRYILERPWLEKLYFIGLVFFVMFPLRGTGGIGGFIVGRMLGMTKKEVLLAITLGAFIGCFTIAGGSWYVIGVIKQDLMVGLALIIIIASVILVSYYGYRHYRTMQKKPGGIQKK